MHVIRNGASIWKINLFLCIYHCHAPPTPGRAQVGISGDLQKLSDKFPTPGDDLMLQIPYKSPIIAMGIKWGNLKYNCECFV